VLLCLPEPWSRLRILNDIKLTVPAIMMSNPADTGPLVSRIGPTLRFWRASSTKPFLSLHRYAASPVRHRSAKWILQSLSASLRSHIIDLLRPEVCGPGISNSSNVNTDNSTSQTVCSKIEFKCRSDSFQEATRRRWTVDVADQNMCGIPSASPDSRDGPCLDGRDRRSDLT
jgi:hypothetical protein